MGRVIGLGYHRYMIGKNQTMIPDLAEPITAWRCWVIGGDEATPLLISPKSGTMWPPVEGFESKVIRNPDRNFISAKCTKGLRPEGATPCRTCPSLTAANHYGVGCGIYAYKTMGDLAWDFSPPGLSRHDPTMVGAWNTLIWGKVLLWGTVYEHDHGYRAEFARVEELVVIDGLGDLGGRAPARAAKLAEFYGVPLNTLPRVTRLEIEDHFIERSLIESEKITRAMQKLGADVTKVFVRAAAEIQKFADAFREVAEALEKMKEADRKDDEDG
jgi:hypothetical protein